MYNLFYNFMEVFIFIFFPIFTAMILVSLPAIYFENQKMKRERIICEKFNIKNNR